VGSGVLLQSSSIFWGIAAGDTGSATWDWGYDLIPINFLTTDNYVSWAPGTADNPPTDNGSPVYVSALNDGTTVFVDYGPNDGVFDAVYKLNKLQVIQVYDPDKDNTGMHIVSTSPVAVAWGESPDKAGTGTPYLDMGYTTLPLPIEWIGVALSVEKTVAPTQIKVGEEAQFTVVISVPSTAGSAVTGINLVDNLPSGWVYITGSGNPSDPTHIVGTTLTWDSNWNLTPGQFQTVTFRAKAVSPNTDNPNRNVASAKGQSLGATLTADDDAFVDVFEPPQLTITKFGPSEATVDSTITYTGTLTNIGGSTAYNVVLVDQLPAGLVFVSSSHNANYDPATNTVTWNLGNLPAGTAIPGWITAYVLPSFSDGAQVDNNFKVTWADAPGGPVYPPATADWVTTLHTNPRALPLPSPQPVGGVCLQVDKLNIAAPWLALGIFIPLTLFLTARKRRV